LTWAAMMAADVFDR